MRGGIPAVGLWALGTLWGGTAVAYESAYAPTEVGVVEVKNLPAATVLYAPNPDKSGDMGGSFRILFRYIQSNSIPMTIPVESPREQNPGMRFYLGSAVSNRTFASTEGVQVVSFAPRTVVSVGLQGRYTQGQFDRGVRQIREWLPQHPEWEAAGEPYAVYWNSPFRLFFLRRAEVHLPVRPVARKPEP